MPDFILNMFSTDSTLTEEKFIGIDLQPFINESFGLKTSQKQEEQQIISNLNQIFSPSTHDYRRITLLEKLGGVSKVMQLFGTIEDAGMQNYELEESKRKYGRNDSMIWNLITCSILITSIKNNANILLPLGFLAVSLMVKWWIFGFWLTTTLLYSSFYLFILLSWNLSEEISAVITWIFNEFWYIGNKTMKKKILII